MKRVQVVLKKERLQESVSSRRCQKHTGQSVLCKILFYQFYTLIIRGMTDRLVYTVARVVKL